MPEPVMHDEELTMLLQAIRLRSEGRAVDAYHLLIKLLEIAPANLAAQRQRDEIYRELGGVYKVNVYMGRIPIAFRVPLDAKSAPMFGQRLGGPRIPDWLPLMQAGVLAAGSGVYLGVSTYVRSTRYSQGLGVVTHRGIAGVSAAPEFSPLPLLLGALVLLSLGAAFIVKAEMQRRDSFDERSSGENPLYEDFKK